MKRTLVMLAKEYDPLKFQAEGSYISEKLDGVRCLWLPFTAGLPIAQIPWANRARDARDYVCSGLWTRRGKPILAPQSWLDMLPRDCPLDGELFAGRGKFQTVTSTVRKLNPVDSEWMGIEYRVFDIPNYVSFFQTGQIREGGRADDPSYEVYFKSDWINQWPQLRDSRHYPYRRFNETVSMLEKMGLNWDKTIVSPLPQIQLSHKRQVAEDTVNEILARVTEDGGEGVMLRRPHSHWMPNRCQELVKVKKLYDAEAVICGYTFGVGKLTGMVGAFRVRAELKGKKVAFDLSGFTDAERQVKFIHQRVAEQKPGEFTEADVSEQFPLGMSVTFAYNDLTDDGVPRFARYLRRAVSV